MIVFYLYIHWRSFPHALIWSCSFPLVSQYTKRETPISSGKDILPSSYQKLDSHGYSMVLVDFLPYHMIWPTTQLKVSHSFPRKSVLEIQSCPLFLWWICSSYSSCHTGFVSVANSWRQETPRNFRVSEFGTSLKKGECSCRWWLRLGCWGHVGAMFLFNRFYSNKKIKSLVSFCFFCPTSVLLAW